MPISSSKITTYITTIETYLDYWRDLIEEVESHFPEDNKSVYANEVATKLKTLLGVKSAKKGDAHYYAKANEAIPYDKKCSEKLYDTQIPNKTVLGSQHFLDTLTKENEQSVQYNVESALNSLNALTRLNVMIAEERPVLDVIIILHAYLRSVNEDSYEYLLSDQQLETELDKVTAKLELLAKERDFSDAKITQQLENWRQNIDFEQNHNNVFTAKVQKLEATTTILTKVKNENDSDMKEVITALASIQDELSRFSAFIEQNSGVMDTAKDALGLSNPNSQGVSYTSRNQIAADPRYKQEATQAINLLAGNNKDAYASISRLTESLAEKQNNSIQGAIQASEDVVRSATTSKIAKDKSVATLRAGGLFHTTMMNEKKALYVGDEAIFTIVAEKLLPKILPGFIGYSYDPDDKTSKDKLDKSMAKRENAADWRTKIMSVSIKNTNKHYYARAFFNTALALMTLYVIATAVLHIYITKYQVAPWLQYGLLTQPTGQLILAIVLTSSLLMLMTSHYYKTKMQASQKQFLQECGIQERQNGWLKSRIKWLCSGWQWRLRTQAAPTPPVPAARLSLSQRLCSWISPCNRYQPPAEELDETLEDTNTAAATNV